MKDFIIEKRSEPPKIYVDELEKTRTIEFVTHTTKIVKGGDNKVQKVKTNTDKEKLISKIEDNFYELKDMCKVMDLENIIPLLRNYTSMIIKIIKDDK